MAAEHKHAAPRWNSHEGNYTSIQCRTKPAENAAAPRVDFVSVGHCAHVTSAAAEAGDTLWRVELARREWSCSVRIYDSILPFFLGPSPPCRRLTLPMNAGMRIGRRTSSPSIVLGGNSAMTLGRLSEPERRSSSTLCGGCSTRSLFSPRPLDAKAVVSVSRKDVSRSPGCEMLVPRKR